MDDDANDSPLLRATELGRRLRPGEARPFGAAFVLLGGAASLFGAVAVFREPDRLGWGVAMWVLGAPVLGIGVQLLIAGRTPGLSRWATWLAALGMCGAAVVGFLDGARGMASSALYLGMLLGIYAWRRRRDDA